MQQQRHVGSAHERIRGARAACGIAKAPGAVARVLPIPLALALSDAPLVVTAVIVETARSAVVASIVPTAGPATAIPAAAAKAAQGRGDAPVTRSGERQRGSQPRAATHRQRVYGGQWQAVQAREMRRGGARAGDAAEAGAGGRRREHGRRRRPCG